MTHILFIECVTRMTQCLTKTDTRPDKDTTRVSIYGAEEVKGALVALFAAIYGPTRKSQPGLLTTNGDKDDNHKTR